MFKLDIVTIFFVVKVDVENDKEVLAEMCEFLYTKNNIQMILLQGMR